MPVPVPYESPRSNYWSCSGRDLVALEPANAFSVGAIFREPLAARLLSLLLLSECEPATGPENALLKIDGDRFLLSFHVSGITTVLNVNFVGTFL